MECRCRLLSTRMADGNIVLTGFMATGKSSVGRELADRLGYEWVDTDSLIESRHGSVAEIFRERGESEFRRMEGDVAKELGRRTGLVISTGGGTLLDPGNERNLCRAARVFCLTATPEEILRRVNAQGDVERPLLAGDDPRGAIAAKLAEREKAYLRFEQVTTEGRSLDEVVTDIVRRIGEVPMRHEGAPRPI